MLAWQATVSDELVAVEIQSSLRRLEQLIRWTDDKVPSLSSRDRSRQLGPVPETSKLLLVRATQATREIGRDVGRQLSLAYPAHPQDALTALTRSGTWPGAALVWVDLTPAGVRFLPNRLG